jgi:hypothetical protein
MTQRVVRMSGALATDELEILRDQIGRAAYDRALERLEASARDELRALTAVGWIDVEIVKAVFVAAAEVTGRRAEDIHRDAIRAGTERTFRHVWRLFLRITTDESLITRAPARYAKTYDTGRLSARMTGRGRAELIVEGWPNAEEFSMRGLGIGIETVLGLAGRVDVKVSFYRTAEGAKFLASWST